MTNDDILVKYYELLNDSKKNNGLIQLEIFSLLVELKKDDLQNLIKKYLEIIDDKLKIAYIYSTIELSSVEKKSVIDRLTKEYGSAFVPSFKIDKAIFGGVKIVIGDNIIDFSLSRKVNDLLNEL